MITFSNFFTGTEALFKGCKKPKRTPDYISYYVDSWTGEKKISSSYWYGENKRGKYVIRESDHWVKMKKLSSNNQIKNIKNVATCLWHFKGKDAFEKIIREVPSSRNGGTEKIFITVGKKKICGKCYLKDFKKL